jgi:cytochrome c553
MNSQAPRVILKNVCAIAVFGAMAFAPLAIAEAKKPKYTVKEVMQAIHKGQDNIGKRATQGAASKEDISKLADYYESLPLNEPPRGPMASWKEKTGKLVASASALKAGKPGAAEMYKAASNCKACHNEHKPEDKK